MHQFTAAPETTPLTGPPGLRVLAATPGLAPDRLALALQVVQDQRPAPGGGGRLALLDVPDLGRLLLHTLPGQPVTRVLLDLPPEVTPLLALQSRGAPVWRQGGPESAAPADLPEVTPADLAASPEGDLADTDLLRFLLTALLTAQPGQRIFVAATEEAVARALEGALRIVPRSLTQGLTFSTCEADPLGCPARVVGTSRESAHGGALPAVCFAAGLAFDTGSGELSPVADPPAFLGEALAPGLLPEVEAFGKAFDRLGLGGAQHLDLAWALHRGDTSPERLDAALAVPALAALLASRPALASAVLRRAERDARFRREGLPTFLTALEAFPVDQRRLAEEAHQAGLAALTGPDPDLARARALIEEVLPALAPGRADRVWAEVFAAASAPPPEGPERMPADVRLFLLPRVLPAAGVTAGSTGAARRLAERWLTVPPELMPDVLAMPLAPGYKLLACQACLGRYKEAPPAVVEGLAARPELLLDVLSKVGEARGKELFTRVVERLTPGHLADDLLRRAGQFPTGLLDHALEALFRHGEGGPEWAARSGRALAQAVPGGRSLAALASRVLAGPGDDLGPAVLEFLALVNASNTSSLTTAERQQLQDLVGVESFLEKTALTEEALSQVALTLAVGEGAPAAHRERQRERVLRRVAEVLWKVPTDPQVALERVLAILGPCAGGAPALYARLVTDYAQRPDLAQHKLLLHALVAVGFGDTHRAELGERLGPGRLDACVSDLVGRVTAGRPGREVFAYLDRRAESWSAEARARWQAQATAVAVPAGAEEARPAGKARGRAARWLDWKDVVLFLLVLAVAVLGALVVYALRGPVPEAVPVMLK